MRIILPSLVAVFSGCEDRDAPPPMNATRLISKGNPLPSEEDTRPISEVDVPFASDVAECEKKVNEALRKLAGDPRSCPDIIIPWTGRNVEFKFAYEDVSFDEDIAHAYGGKNVKTYCNKRVLLERFIKKLRVSELVPVPDEIAMDNPCRALVIFYVKTYDKAGAFLDREAFKQEDPWTLKIVSKVLSVIEYVHSMDVTIGGDIMPYMIGKPKELRFVLGNIPITKKSGCFERTTLDILDGLGNIVPRQHKFETESPLCQW